MIFDKLRGGFLLFIRFLRYLRGHVKFFARSGSFERLINLCAHHRVPLWDCRREEAGYSGRTTVDGYRRMRPLARKAGAVTRVKERHGLPFLLRRYRRRIGVAAGAALFIAFFAVTQQFVWVVEVQGNERVDSQVLLQALEELGVRRGVLKSGLDAREIQLEVQLKVDDLSWAALNIRGTTATLLVRERTVPPQKIDTKVPANVVAARDGQIVSMAVTDGRAAVQKGDAVREGEILVSGVFEDRWGLNHLLRANAKVIARVPESLAVEVPLTQSRAVPSGRVVKRRYLELPGVRLPLFLYSGLDGEYKVEKVTRPPVLFGVEMPFPVTRETYIFYETEEERISAETALRIAERQLLELPGVRLPLFLYSGLDGEYKVEKVTRPPVLFGVEMPFPVTRETYIFYETEEERISAETALRIAERQLAAKERGAWASGTVVKREVSAKTEGGRVVLTGEYLVEMDIARQVEIPVFDRTGQGEKALREGGY